MKTLLCIPVFNEEGTLSEVVRETLAVFDQHLNRMLLIDDGSTDSSPQIMRELQAKDSRIETISHESNRGYGAAMIESLQFAAKHEYDFLITMDCDRQHRPEDLQRFMDFAPGVDVVSGSRYMNDSKRSGKAPQDRVLINQRITALLNRIFQWALTDAFCGFKRYRLKNIDVTAFTENGYAFPLEFWAYASAKKLHIAELSVARIYTTDDRSFGEDLDKIRKRYRYYRDTLYNAQKRFQPS